MHWNPPDGNAIGNAEWTGLELKPLLDRADIKPNHFAPGTSGEFVVRIRTTDHRGIRQPPSRTTRLEGATSQPRLRLNVTAS